MIRPYKCFVYDTNNKKHSFDTLEDGIYFAFHFVAKSGARFKHYELDSNPAQWAEVFDAIKNADFGDLLIEGFDEHNELICVVYIENVEGLLEEDFEDDDDWDEDDYL